MFYFVLNDKEINVINAPVINEDLNKDLDSGELTLQLSKDIKEIAPRTSFILKNDNEIILSAIVISDEINVMEKNNEIAYCHKIEYEESISDLKYYQVRNSVFSQPANNIISIRSSVRVPNQSYYAIASLGDTPHFASQSVIIPPKAKIKRSYFKFKLLSGEDNNPTVEGEQYKTWYLTTDYDTTLDKVNIYVNDNLAINLKSVKTNTEIDINTSFLKQDYTENKITKINFMDETFYESKVCVIMIATLNIEYYYYTLYDILDILKKQTELKEE